MQLCNIDKSQRELLYRAIAAIINDAIQNKQPIDTKKIGNQIYDIVYKKSQDNAKALSYVLLVPKAIDQILSFNDNFKDYAVNNKFEFDKLAKLVSSLNKSSEETILNDISTFLGKMSNKNSFEDAQKDLQNLQSEQAKNKNSKILVPSSYLAKPESLYTTTGQQGLREDINIPDPSMQFYYDIIKKLNTNYINEEGGVVYPNVKSGLFLSIISGVNIADNEMYTRDAGNRNEYNKNFFLALTDNLGKIMYFDTNYNVVERSAGKPIYFPLRTNLDSIVDKLNIGQSQLESLREAAKFINQDKVNNRVVNKITFKSDGYLSTSNSLPKVDIASIKNNNILTFVTVPGSNQLYVSSKGEYHFTVDVSFKDFTTVRANLIADLILNPVYKDGKLLSNNDKYNILSNWLFQREMKFGQKNKKFYVTLNGQSLNLEDKEDSKEKIVNFLTRKIKTDKTEYQNKFTWQSRLLENNETISLFSLSVEDGKYIYTDNPVSYQEYLKQITFAKIQTVDGEIFPMNGYIGYELGNRISKPKPVETKVEIKKQTPVTLDTNEYNRAVKEADSKKPIEQNFFDGYRPNSDKTKIHTIRPEITSIYGKGVKTLKLVQEGIRTRSTRLANWMKENNPKVGDYFWQINKKNPSEKVLTRITAVYDKTDPRFKNNWFKEGWVDSDFKYVENYAGAIEFEVIKSVVATSATTVTIPTQKGIKPGVPELFESNPELANAVYEALGFNQMITPNDKVVFGHPTIGKSFLKKQGEGRFITLDDDYKDEVNAFVDANRGSETRQEYKGRKPKEYNEFMLNLYDRLKVQAQREGKILFVSNTNILKERMSDFDKVITIPKAEFKRRFDERGATYGFEDWKSEIDATVAKVPSNKVITTTGYLADLFITPQQKQQAQQLYSQYLDTIFPDSKEKDIFYHGSSESIDPDKLSDFKNRAFYVTNDLDYAKVYKEKGTILRLIINSQYQYKKAEGIIEVKETEKDRLDLLKNLEKIKSGELFGGANFGSFAAWGDFDVLTPRNFRFFKTKEEFYNANKYDNLTAIDQENVDDIINYVKNRLSEIQAGRAYDTVVTNAEGIWFKAIFDREKAHFLGSKQDIEGFKEFVSAGVQPQVTTEEKFDLIPTRPISEIEKEIESFESEIRYAAGQLEQLQAKMELVEDEETIESFILSQFTPVNPESARKETGTNIGTKQDINPALLNKRGPSVERLAEEIGSLARGVPYHFRAEDDYIRDQIIEILVKGKAKYKEELQGGNLQDIKYYEERINDISKKLDELNVELENAKLAPPVSTPQETVQIESIEESIVNESETKEEDIDLGEIDPNDLKNLLEKRILQKESEVKATNEKIKKALPWYNSIKTKSGKKLSSFLPIKEMFDAVNTSNPNAIAHWSMSGITLFNGSDYSDLYHEAWHAFTQQFLTTEERNNLYNAVRGKSGTFEDYNGNIVEFSLASKKQIEEFLAEEFREFMLRDGKGMYEKKSIFSKIFNKIRELLLWLFDRTTYYDVYNNSKATRNISRLFNELRIGELAEPVNEVDPDFAIKGLDRVIKVKDSSDTFTIEESKTISDTIDSLFSEYSDKVNNATKVKSASIQLQISPTFQLNAYKYAKNRLIQRKNELVQKVKTKLSEKKIDDLNTEELNLFRKDIKNINLLKKAIKAFIIPENLNNVKSAKEIDGIISSHQQLSEYLKDIVQLEEEYNILNNNVIADRAGNANSFEQLTDPKLLYTFGGVFERDEKGEIIKNSLGFNKTMAPKRVFNKLSNILETNDNEKRPNNITALYKKMESLQETDPFIKDILNKLGSPYTTNTNVNSLWSALEVLILPVAHVMRAEIVKGDNNSISAVFVTNASLETESAIRSFANYTAVLDSSDPNNFLFENADGVNIIDLRSIFVPTEGRPKNYGNSKAAQENPLEFLRAIGIYLPNDPNVIKELMTEEAQEYINRLYNAALEIKNYNYSKGTKESDKIEVFSIKEILKDYSKDPKYKNVKKLPKGQSVAKKFFTKLYLKYSDQSNNLSITTVDDKTVFQRSLPNTLMMKAQIINSADSFNNLVSIPETEDLAKEINGKTKNPWSKASQLLNKVLFDEKGNKREGARIDIASLDGLKIRLDEVDLAAIKSSDSDPYSKQLLDIIFTLEYGVSEATRHAGKSSTFLFEITRSDGSKHYIDLEKFTRNISKGENIFNSGIVDAVNIFVNYLASEYERIQLATNDPENKNIRTGNGKSMAEVGSEFLLFKDIIPKSILDNIKSIEGVETYEDFLQHLDNNVSLRDSIKKNIYNYLNNVVKQELNDFNKLNVKKEFNDILHKKMKSASQRALKGGKITKETEFNYNQLRNSAITAYTINSLIHNIETGLLFYGDPAIFNNNKQDYQKRNSGAGSTGIVTRTDDAYLQFINSKGGLGKVKNEQRNFDGTLNTVVLNDPKTTAKLYNEYIKAAKNKESERLKKLKKSQKEIDIALKKTEEKFSEAYENMKEADAQGYISFSAYRALSWGMNKWTLAQELGYQKIMNGEKIDNADILYPVRKYQYWGSLQTKGLPATAFHKFSLLPLIPTLTENAPHLNALRMKMENEGIDYLTFETGSKAGTIAIDNKLDNLYKGDSSDRILDLPVEFTKNVVFAKFLKEQLSIAPQFKETVTFSTQLRKLVIEGLWEEGEPVGKNEEEKNNVKQKTAAYINAVNNLTELLFIELKDKAGINPETNKVENKVKLIDYLTNALENKDTPYHIIEQIASLKTRLQTGISFDYLIQASDIEKLITGLVYKKVINQKVYGEGLIQVSTAGWAVKKDDNLKFYRTENGVVKPMQVKIAMQGEFLNLLQHPDVLDIVSAEENITELQALNRLLKDEAWVNKNREMITLMGPRIPVQGLNSMEVMEIAEFLPRNYGNVIVVPSEIVGKAGSDFDVDKLSIVFPGIKVYNGVPQVVNFNKNLFKQTTRSQLIKEKVRLEKLVDIAYETRRGLYEMIKDDAIFTDEQRVALERLYAEHKEQMAEVNIRIKELEAQWEETGGAEVLLKGTIPDDYSLQNTLLNTYAERARIRKQFQNNRYLYKSTFIDEDFKNDLEAIENKIDDVTKQIDSISIAAAEYDVLKSTIDILLLPQNFVSLITPNTTIDAKGLSKEMRKRVDFGYSTEDNFLKENKGFSPTRIYEPKYNREKLDYNKVGKDSLGIGAVDNTFNVLLNYVGAYLNNEVDITKDYSRRIVIRGLKHNKYKDTENISLSKIYDANNEFKISDIISQFINGWVDVEKDEWIFFIQGNKELSSTLLFMIQAGIPLNDAVVFLNQPIIRDYYNRVRLALSPASEILEEGKKDKYVRNKVFDDLMYNNDIYRNIYDGEKEKTKKSFSKAGRFYAISTIAEKYKFDKESLESKLSNPIGTYSQDDYAILGHFFELRENANSLTNIKMALNFDTKRETSIDEVKEKLNKRGQIYGSILPKEIINKLLNESPISSFNIQKDIVAMMEALFPVRMSDVVEDAINDTDETVWKNIGENLNFDDRTKIVDAKNAFRNALIPYLFQESYYSLNEEEYRGYKIKYTSDYADRVVVISPTEPDVILINQTAVDNLITSTNNNSKKLYMPEFMLTAYGVASLPVNTFKNINENIGLRKYLIEREIQRTLDENSFEKISKSLLYKTYKNKLKIEDVNNPYLSVNNQLTSLTSQLNISKEEAYNLLAYELVLRDKSLNNLNFPGWLFYDTKNEQTSYGSQLNYIKRKYNFLEREFSVLDALEVRRNKNTNEVNIKLKDTRITGSEKNIFQSQINMLSDPQKLLEIKSSLSEADINEITSFFKRFHVFAYLQSAANSTSSTYNLLPIANPMVIENLIAQPIQDFASFEYDQFSENNEEVTNYIIERDDKIETVETAIKNYNNILSAQFKTNHVTLIKQRFEWNADTLSLQEQQAAEENNLKLLKAQNPLGLVEVPTKAEKNIIKNKGKKTVFSLITNSLGQAYLYESEAKGLDAVVIENLDTLKDDYLFIGNTGTETFTDGTISKVDDGKLLQSQAFLGVPSRKIKGDLTDETLEENKKLIDDAIQNILNRRSNKFLVFNKNGYGQNLIGRNPNNASELKGKVTAPKTFQYLSQKLAQHFGFVNPNLTLQSTVDESKVKTISTDYGVVTVETDINDATTEKFIEILRPQIATQAYIENKSADANLMFNYGLRWTRKSNAISPVIISSWGAKEEKEFYAYDTVDQDGKPLPQMLALTPIIEQIENSLGIDMSNYDSVIGNIYEPGQKIATHRDTTEDVSARNYPVIVYTLGNNNGINIYENEKNPGKTSFASDKKTSIQTKNGTVYTFGLNGFGRFEMAHDTPGNILKNVNYPAITLPDGRIITNYTITLTFRRAQKVGEGTNVPTSPTNFNTTNTNTTVTVNKPSEYTNHSGGAKGADTAWDVEAKKLGYLTNDVHWREPDKTEIDSLELKKLGRTATPMSPELYARGKQIADIIDESFGEDPNRALSHYRYRNYAQVANSDAVFAISQGFGVRPKDPKKRYAPLDRGTLYAIYGAIYDGKPVYVYDQMASVWRTFNRETKKWQETGIPKLTKNFAGVGSRTLEENGRQAIIDVLKNTFGQNAPSSITPSKISVPLTSLEIYNAIINDIKSCGI